MQIILFSWYQRARIAGLHAARRVLADTEKIVANSCLNVTFCAGPQEAKEI